MRRPANFAAELGRTLLYVFTQNVVPMLRIAALKDSRAGDVWRPATVPSRDPVQILGPNGFGLRFTGVGCRPAISRMSSREKNGFECNGRLSALVTGEFVVEGGDDLGSGGLLVERS